LFFVYTGSWHFQWVRNRRTGKQATTPTNNNEWLKQTQLHRHHSLNLHTLEEPNCENGIDYGGEGVVEGFLFPLLTTILENGVALDFLYSLFLLPIVQRFLIPFPVFQTSNSWEMFPLLSETRVLSQVLPFHNYF